MQATAQWTEKLYPPAGGQDHLGLASVSSDRVLPKLSGGILVLTIHPRYVSFYTFLLDEFWRRDLLRTKAAFARFYRPREAIFAVAAHLCNRPEHSAGVAMQGIVGSIKAGALARSGAAAFEATFDYIKEDLGGYGLYYGAMIADFGLTLRAHPEAGLPYDTPTPEGHALAAAFRSTIADTTYYRDYFDVDDAIVPREVAVEYIRSACLCQLSKDEAPDRPLLRDVYLHAGGREGATARTATLRLFLELADQTSGVALTEDRFRQLVYFRCDEAGASWAPRDALIRIARRWRLYQAREYYAFALNRLWRYFVEWGQGVTAVSRQPVAYSEWCNHLDGALTSSALASAFGIDDPGLNADSMLGEWSSWAARTASVAGNLDTSWACAPALHEHSLYRWSDPNTGPAVVAANLTILALVAARFGGPEVQRDYENDWDICRDGGVARLGLQRFFRQWRQFIQSGASVGQAARRLVDDYVIRQHMRIAVAKLANTGDTFRFWREGNLIEFYDADAPASMSSSRFQAIATSVHELGFVQSLFGTSHLLSSGGVELLDDGELSEIRLFANHGHER